MHSHKTKWQCCAFSSVTQSKRSQNVHVYTFSHSHFLIQNGNKNNLLWKKASIDEERVIFLGVLRCPRKTQWENSSSEKPRENQHLSCSHKNIYFSFCSAETTKHKQSKRQTQDPAYFFIFIYTHNSGTSVCVCTFGVLWTSDAIINIYIYASKVLLTLLLLILSSRRLCF